MFSRTALCTRHQTLTRTNAVSRRIVYRSMHLACRMQSAGLRSHSVLKISKYTPVLGACTKRYASTGDPTIDAIVGIQAFTPASTQIFNATTDMFDTNVGKSSTAQILEPIPDVPVPPAPTVLETVSYIGEPPLETMGLGGWWPQGMIQQGVEFLHVGWGLPWWEAIVVGTLIIRTVLLPLMIISQRNAANLHNNLPELQRLQQRMREAREEGDELKSARYGQEMRDFMAKSECNPLKSIIVPIAQAPIFISCFFGLRGMAEYPLESMKDGGLWWFTDLTIADPYYVLPLITAATFAATIELGTDSAKAKTMGMMRYFIRAIPVISLPFTIHFPGAILCYWVSSNFISLLQVAIFKIPKVRQYFKIAPLIKHPPTDLAKKEGFVEGFKSSWSNIKASREANTRFETDEIQFQQAGRGPLRKTYSYDPTKQLWAEQKPAVVMAKKR